jgi:tetratricopeptide (TPR) repeat protein
MSSIARSLDTLVQEAPAAFWRLLPILEDAARTVLLPIVVGLVCAAAVKRIFEIIYRIIFPLSAQQLHKEALGCLKKSDDDKGKRDQAKQLLQRSISKDPKYLPARLSLAALQLYQEGNCKEAMITIQEAQAKFPKNKELKNLEMDVKAMTSNSGHMVLTGSFASTYL